MEITKPQKVNDSITFTISNKDGLDVSLINSIRRTMINELPCVGFDTETDNNVYFAKNNTVLHNEYLEHRVGMIPLNINPEKYKPKELLFVLNIKNETADTLEITTNHFNIYKIKDNAPEFNIKDLDLATFKQIYNDTPLTQEEKDKIINPFKFRNENHYITITYLKNENITGDDKEELVMFAIPTINIGKVNARFNNVSLATYNYTIDPEKADIERKARGKENEKSFDSLDIQRFYKSDKLDRPNSYDFKIESLGYLSNMNCFKKSIDILIQNSLNLKDRINKENEVTISESKDIQNGVDIVIQNEDDTLGNPIQKIIVQEFIELTKKKRVDFCSYTRPHPLYSHITFKLVTKEDPKVIMSDAIDICINTLNEIKAVL